MSAQYPWTPGQVVKPLYEDLGLLVDKTVDGTDIADAASVFTPAIVGKEWERTIIIGVLSQKNYDVVIKRTDKDGVECDPVAISSTETANPSAWKSFETTILGGASFKIGVKNISGDASTSDISITVAVQG